MKAEFICTRCPMGCLLQVTLEEEQITVTGNRCPRGESYGKKEMQNPTRVVTSTIRVENGEIPMVSVKTKEDIPKDKIFEVMEVIRKTKAVAPILLGDVLIQDCAGTGVDVIATKTVNQRS